MKKDEIAKLVSTGINELNSALAEGRSVRLEQVLKLMARFHKYSFNNCLLIAQQMAVTQCDTFQGLRFER